MLLASSSTPAFRRFHNLRSSQRGNLAEVIEPVTYLNGHDRVIAEFNDMYQCPAIEALVDPTVDPGPEGRY